jgi:hypothetical protein
MHLAAAKFAYSTLLVYTTAYSSAYDALTLLLTRRSGRKYLFRSALLTVGRTLFRLVFFSPFPPALFLAAIVYGSARGPLPCVNNLPLDTSARVMVLSRTSVPMKALLCISAREQRCRVKARLLGAIERRPKHLDD